jgi:hypothetical protein
MKQQPISQHYWLKKAYDNYTAESGAPAFHVVTTQEPKPETWWQTFKRQASGDKITIVLLILCTLLAMAVVVAQVGKTQGW